MILLPEVKLRLVGQDDNDFYARHAGCAWLMAELHNSYPNIHQGLGPTSDYGSSRHDTAMGLDSLLMQETNQLEGRMDTLEGRMITQLKQLTALTKCCCSTNQRLIRQRG
jgi:hypothetical protein